VRLIAGLLACAAAPVLLSVVEARQAGSEAKHVVVPAGKAAFEPIEVPGFPTGMKIAALAGDPNATSGTYVIRLQFPDGYKFPPHWHPMAENLTVLSGTFLLGMGEKDSGKVVSYSPGAFMSIPAKMPHFGGAKGATVIQLHGQAPFKIELVTAK
jgi:quercetin dioxygenase-like cupin family protein